MATKTDFSVTKFLTAMNLDGLRNNLFEITLDAMNGDSTASTGKDNFSFKAKASNIPKSSIGTVQAQYFGRNVLFAGNRNFEPWGISILMDENDYGTDGIRTYFEQWLDGINGNSSNIRTGARKSPDINNTNTSYFRDGSVIHYSKTGDKLATYEMIGCFPVDVSGMPLDWGGNGISEFTVTLALQWWERTPDSNATKKTN